MTHAELEQKFAEALRLGMAGDAPPGTSIVNVAAPSVSVSPRVEAVLPMPSEPVEVVDIERWAGTWRWRMDVTRNNAGLIQTVEMRPTKFVPAEEIQNDRP